MLAIFLLLFFEGEIGHRVWDDKGKDRKEAGCEAETQESGCSLVSQRYPKAVPGNMWPKFDGSTRDPEAETQESRGG